MVLCGIANPSLFRAIRPRAARDIEVLSTGDSMKIVCRTKNKLLGRAARQAEDLVLGDGESIDIRSGYNAYRFNNLAYVNLVVELKRFKV